MKLPYATVQDNPSTGMAVMLEGFSRLAFCRTESSAGLDICNEDEGRSESKHANTAKLNQSMLLQIGRMSMMEGNRKSTKDARTILYLETSQASGW